MQDSMVRQLEGQYAGALRDYLADPDEAVLQRAYELGRRAIDGGLGLLDLVAMHHEALESVLEETTGRQRGGATVEAAGRFLAESVAPFEMTHRGFQEAITALRQLNERLEEEARRIAHALHDDAGQLLVSVHLALEEASAGLPVRSRDRLAKIRGLLDEIEKHLRRLSHELRPTLLDDLGLLPALEFLAQGVAARSSLRIAVAGPREPRLPASIETALYRVVQEALRNAARHAGASQVEIRLEIGSGATRCSVKDDGRGFDVPAALGRKGERGLGLIGMRERLNALGGGLTIESAPGRGTDIQITIPLEEHDADSSSLG